MTFQKANMDMQPLVRRLWYTLQTWGEKEVEKCWCSQGLCCLQIHCSRFFMK